MQGYSVTLAVYNFNSLENRGEKYMYGKQNKVTEDKKVSRNKRGKARFKQKMRFYARRNS